MKGMKDSEATEMSDLAYSTRALFKITGWSRVRFVGIIGIRSAVHNLWLRRF